MATEVAPTMAREPAQEPRQTVGDGFQGSEPVCPVCGGPARQKTRRGEPKVYCSDRCRRRHWHQIHRKPVRPRRRRAAVLRRALRAEVTPERFDQVLRAAAERGLSLPEAVRLAVDSTFPPAAQSDVGCGY